MPRLKLPRLELPGLLPRAAHGASLSRLVWPVAGLLALTLAFGAATALGSAGAAREAAAERGRALLSAALAERASELRGRVAALERAARPGAKPITMDPFRATGLPLDGLSGLMLVRPGAPLAHRGLEAGVPSPSLGAALAEVAARDPSRLAAGRLVTDGTALVAAASAPVGPATLVAYRRLEGAEIAALAERHGLAGLALTREVPAGAAALPLAAGAEPIAYLTWRPAAPEEGQGGILAGLAALVILAAALFGAFLLSIRGVARELAERAAQAQRLVGRDPLSGLPNRLLFAERLDQELCRTARTGEGLAVLFMDLDRFKDVNDTFGHGVGDALLIEVGKRLAALLRGEDTLARFGGDEFAVIQTRADGGDDAGVLARRILDSLTEPFVLNGTAVSVGVSIGIALAPVDGLEGETLMRLADTALYQAKSEGRNRFRFFARAMDEVIQMRKVVEDDLRHAIKTDGLRLHYQPIYSADGRTVVAVEALVRWPHPEHGMISPAKFIAVAEERGLVIPLGEWVLRRACNDAVRWPGVRLAVNVSAIQFHHRDFVASVVRALRESGFPAENLEIELTEGVLVDDEAAAQAAMMELRALGVNLALDDFGTGYSSLIYLRRFAFDKIKIDRSFLESLESTGESAILVHSIVHLGRALGLTVTAEGVETREQQRFLQALGCHQLQGFLFSPAVPADIIDGMVGVVPRAVAAA